MAGPAVIHHDKSMLHKWFGPNRGTHWTIAGAVAVIVLGSYLVYSNRDQTPVTASTTSAAQQTPAPTAPALPPQKAK